MKRYIDCDGVILDTEEHLFDWYWELKKDNPSLTKTAYLIEYLDWHSWLRESAILGDAINILKNYDTKDVDILTKVQSMHEAIEKVTYFRELGVRNNVVIVPNVLTKANVVDPLHSILVDDHERNLDYWFEQGGLSYYFGSKESIYPKVDSILEVVDPVLLQKRIPNYRINKISK